MPVKDTKTSMLRQISPTTLTCLQQQYDTSETYLPRIPGLPTTADVIRHRQELALQARKHMMPHSGDGLPKIEDNNEDSKAAVRLLVDSLPTIGPDTPYGHLDGLKKSVIFVAISITEAFQLVRGGEAHLGRLQYAPGEVFWVAGQSEDGKCFVAKSQEVLILSGEARNWEDSKWGLVRKDNCNVALLDIKRGGWIVCRTGDEVVSSGAQRWRESPGLGAEKVKVDLKG